MYNGKSDFDQNHFEQEKLKRYSCKSLNFNNLENDGTEFDLFVAFVRPKKTSKKPHEEKNLLLHFIRHALF